MHLSRRHAAQNNPTEFEAACTDPAESGHSPMLFAQVRLRTKYFSTAERLMILRQHSEAAPPDSLCSALCGMSRDVYTHYSAPRNPRRRQDGGLRIVGFGRSLVHRLAITFAPIHLEFRQKKLHEFCAPDVLEVHHYHAEKKSTMS